MSQSIEAINLALSTGKLDKGELLARTLIKKESRNPEAYHLAGVACYMQGKPIEAEALLLQALKLRQDARYYLNLALTLKKLGKTDAAIEAYRDTLRLQPANAQARNNLANIYNDLHRFEEAETLYREAIRTRPDYAMAYKNLGLVLRKTGRYDEAESHLRQAVALAPQLIEARSELAVVLERKKKFGEAAQLVRGMGNWCELQRLLRINADWRYIDEIDRAAIDQVKQGVDGKIEPWGLINIPSLTPDLHRQAGHRFAAQQYLTGPGQRPVSAPGSAAERLKIGYLSSDFFDHATMHLLMGVLEAHDPARVEVHLFSYSPRRDDRFTRRLAESGLPLHDLRLLSDEAAARSIAAEGLHLLVDLKGYTQGARLGITALRPAPVIVSWLGYPGSLGHPCLADFIIGDAITTPPEHAGHFSETLALMPHCYQPNDRARRTGVKPTRADAGLPESGFVYCSFNQTTKINPEVFDAWCGLLRATPESVLWQLHSGSGEANENMRREAEQRGVGADRVIFAPFLPQEDHLGRLQHADLALDTSPYCSHTTASDLIWAGVPLVTKLGGMFAGRVAASMLSTHGFAELVAESDEQYFHLALSLARSPDKLAAIRQRLDAARLQTPLFDTDRFARDLEQLYRMIWERHCSAPQNKVPIAVSGIRL